MKAGSIEIMKKEQNNKWMEIWRRWLGRNQIIFGNMICIRSKHNIFYASNPRPKISSFIEGLLVSVESEEENIA